MPTDDSNSFRQAGCVSGKSFHKMSHSSLVVKRQGLEMILSAPASSMKNNTTTHFENGEEKNKSTEL